MASAAQHGRAQAPKLAATGMTHAPPAFTTWLPTFLREELRPYPGRTVLALRYTLAATITMLLIVTFRLPGAAVGGFYSLLVPRDTLITTVRGGLSLVLAFGTGLAFVLLGAILFVDYPLTHFLWVVVSFFMAFYGLSVLSNYGAASAFAIVIVLSIPLWDQALPQDVLVAGNLFTALSVAVAIVSTLAVEFVFSLFSSTNELLSELDERLEVVQQLLRPHTLQKDPHASKSKLDQFAIKGVSRLRQLLLSSGLFQQEKDRFSAVISHVNQLVDLLSAFDDTTLNTTEAARVQAMAEQVMLVRRRLKGESSAPLTPLQLQPEGSLLVGTLEQTINLLDAAAGAEATYSLEPDYVMPTAPTIFKADIFSNSDHLRFALRGCAASVLCYFIFNAVFWPGLSTSLFSVVVAALPSTGASRQRSVLRVTGALVGGGVLGMGSQVFILPLLDTITGFTVMFVAVTWIAAWFLTSSPRLSYFGAQMGLAFYLIQLRGPSPQTNLALARDNLMGILLGLLMMWFVFEKLGSKSAVTIMRDLLTKNLQQMADLAKPWRDQPANLARLRTVRATISQNFLSFHAQADAVLFETGRSRQRSLAARTHLLRWESQLVSLFLLEVAWVHSRLQVSTEKISPDVLFAIIHFDDEISQLLESMSAQLSGQAAAPAAVEAVYTRLHERSLFAGGVELPPSVRALLGIGARVAEVGVGLSRNVTENN